MTERDLIETIPLVAHEAQCERYTRIVAHMAIGWTICVVLLAIVLLFAFSYEVETAEEVVTTTTETTAEVAQNADNNGSNYYAGGDLNGYSDSQTNSQDDAN